MTLVECGVAVGLFLMVAGVILGVWLVGARLGSSANLTGALQTALLIQQAIVQDVHQLGYDRTVADPVTVGPGAFSFHRVRFQGDRTLLDPVRYEARARGHGLQELVRIDGTSGREERIGGGVLADLRFDLPADPGLEGFLLRVTFLSIEPGRDPGTLRADERQARTHVFAVRLPPVMSFGDPLLDPACKVEVQGPLL